MKVLLQNRPKGLWVGGDIVQLEKTAEALAQKGVDVEIDDKAIYQPALLYRHFDIIHLFNFSMHWTLAQMKVAKIHQKLVACSMIYHESDQFVSYPDQQKMLDCLDAAIFLAPGELERVKRHLKIKDEIIHYVPNGIDEFWFNAPVNIAKKIKNYVLTVGRIEETKGQLGVSIACKNLGLRYVMVGERINNSYASQCEANGAVWFPAMAHKDLINVYANARLFVLASRAEVFPLTVMEAGSQGLNIVLTDHCEWKEIPNVKWCEFENPESIEKAIKSALTLNPNTQLKNKVKKMTWGNVADDLIKIYESIIVDKAR